MPHFWDTNYAYQQVKDYPTLHCYRSFPLSIIVINVLLTMVLPLVESPPYVAHSIDEHGSE